MKYLTRAVCWLWLLALAIPAGSAVLLELSIEEMIDRSDLIVLGEIRDRQVESIRGVLHTRLTVLVSETLKGPSQATVSVLTPGGIDASRKHPIVTVVSGVPNLQPGQRLLWLLRHSDPENTDPLMMPFQIVGFNQGVLVVDPTSTTALLQRPAGAEAPLRQQVSLDGLRAAVRRQARETAPRRAER